MENNQALLIVDVQKDFCPGGSLAVRGGDEIIPVLNKYIALFTGSNIPIFASRDWHPAETPHFKQYGGTWPAHCIKETNGAEFHDDLHLPGNTILVSKGTGVKSDGYSVFEARASNGKGFKDMLERNRIKELFVGGLATDYCVRHTVLDALDYGFEVGILIDAVRGVNALTPDDSYNALNEMLERGAFELTYSEAIDNINGFIQMAKKYADW